MSGNDPLLVASENRGKTKSMKIAIMMRAMDQDSGFHLFLDGLVGSLLELDKDNIYLLLYRTPKYFGRFSSYRNATELLFNAPHKILWDQVAVPFVAWRHKADIIYNPKFSIPFISPCPVVMGVQEPAWWAWPEHYEKMDVFYQKLMLPLYARKASHFFAMTQWDLNETRKYIKLPLYNTTVAYPGVQEHLKPVKDERILEEFRKKHNLPARFILSMTRVDNPGMDKSDKWNPSKNPGTTLKAFLLCRDKIPHHLVFAGRNVKQYFLDTGFSEGDFERVHFADFIPFGEIQNIYTLADLIVVPSYYESFSFTLVGAMACGCPSVASKNCGISEVAGAGALYADCNSPEDFADKICTILTDDELRMRMKRKSLELVASRYAWENTARLTLEGMLKVLKPAQQMAWQT